MLAPNDLIAAAEAVFAAPVPAVAAREAKLQILSVKADASCGWRLLHQEIAPVAPVSEPLSGDLPVIAARQALPSRVWSARNARLVGRRGLIAEDNALFLMGPVRSEPDLARAIADCSTGFEGMLLRPSGQSQAQLLSTAANGDRRLTGTGLHIGTLAAGARPFLLDRFAVLLMIAALRPKLDYLVATEAEPELASLLAELELGELKIFDAERLQGVTCSEILVPVTAHDPAGWVDAATIERLQSFALRLHAKMGPGIHGEPAKIFLTAPERLRSPLAAVAAQNGYEVRSLSGRSVADQAVLMAKASQIATDCAGELTATLFAGPSVAVLDLVGGDPSARLPLLLGAGRPYGIFAPERAGGVLSRNQLEIRQAAE